MLLYKGFISKAAVYYLFNEMVRCNVEGCKWSHKPYPPGEVMPQLHRFPKEKERRDKWVRNVANNLPNDPRICDNHFDDDQYEIDLKVPYFFIYLSD